MARVTFSPRTPPSSTLFPRPQDPSRLLGCAWGLGVPPPPPPLGVHACFTRPGDGFPAYPSPAGKDAPAAAGMRSVGAREPRYPRGDTGGSGNRKPRTGSRTGTLGGVSPPPVCGGERSFPRGGDRRLAPARTHRPSPSPSPPPPPTPAAAAAPGSAAATGRPRACAPRPGVAPAARAQPNPAESRRPEPSRVQPNPAESSRVQPNPVQAT